MSKTFYDKMFRVAIFGLNNVGKSSFIRACGGPLITFNCDGIIHSWELEEVSDIPLENYDHYIFLSDGSPDDLKEIINASPWLLERLIVCLTKKDLQPDDKDLRKFCKSMELPYFKISVEDDDYMDPLTYLARLISC